ncbi:UDP-2,3-diacylglucosamine diphosphatase [Fontimonas sp. SYSU GA230001]|uniref:UDP-2,3-diacylglucosamine diphosphatase n=1 Tax=Fontimonas sp. SYSU GA230001 TaxID=3142450 RepID=UPI0032B3D4EC
MKALFLSDLHLPAEPSPLREGFLRFLAGPARAARSVWLLGDIFEYWIGDDVGLQVYAPEVAALRDLTAHGVAVHFMHGNRDFLVGRRFAHAADVTLAQDPVVVELDGRAALLSHGDLWCTDDHAYQRWRRFSRNRAAQALFVRLPRRLRERVAGGVRSRSDSEKRNKPEAIMDVNPAAIERALRRSGTRLLIHGHTHRPDDHALHIDGQPAQRIVLADWRPQRMEYLEADRGALRRIVL